MAVDTTSPRTRRAILAGALGAAVAGTLGRAQRASAHDPDDLQLGVLNTATGQTKITTTLTNGDGFLAYANGLGSGIYGDSASGAGVDGFSASGIGVDGFSPPGTGLRGVSHSGTGVIGQALNATGATFGVTGESASTSGIGVFGTGGVGVRGESTSGRGGVFKGKAAQVRLTPSSVASHPASGQKGDLFVDSSGRLWFCKGGTTWKQIA
jgi:hypothetical protein